MEYQKFIPEGWKDEHTQFSIEGLNMAKETGEVMEGLVTKCDSNYNLYVDLGKNLTGIIPREEVELLNLAEDGKSKPNLCINKVNKMVQFKVKDVEEDKIILSRKDVEKDSIGWIKNDLKEGAILNGIVRNMQNYGAFVEIGGGIVGLLHIEDMSIARIKTPAERFSIGQKIDIMVKSIDKENGRVILTHKELLGTWEENIKNYEECSTVVGIAREVEKSKNGIFVELMPNLVGLADYRDDIEYGQKVSVFIKKILYDKRKIKLVIL